MSEEYTAYQNAKSNAESYNNDVDTHAYLELFADLKLAFNRIKCSAISLAEAEQIAENAIERIKIFEAK